MISRYIAQYNSSRPNDYVIADANVTQQLGPRANVDIVANLLSAWLIDPAQADYNPVPDPAMISKAGIPTNHNSAEVIDYKALAQWYLTRQFDPGQNLNEFVAHLVDQ